MNNEQLELIKNKLNLNLTKNQASQFNSFEQIFKIYNSHTNLISRNEEKNLFEKHIYDSLSLNLFFEKYFNDKEPLKILDIGTGGGFPSIPISIVFNEFEIHALDSIAKKIGFIELVQKELRLNNIIPLCKRVEDLSVDNREIFDVVTSRAVASLNILLEYAIPYLRTGGYFVAFKSKIADEEINNAQNALKILNSEVIEKINYTLPHEENFVRELVVIKKCAPTPKLYPRKSGQAKKNPL